MRASAVDPEFPYLGEDEHFRFPALGKANEYGVLASGGNLSPGMLLSAYRQGIFPWFSEGEPLLWWSPDPRFVLFPGELHVHVRMKRFLRRCPYELSLDSDFKAVIKGCSSAPRRGQRGTWITEDMRTAYAKLHELGYAHSAEARLDGKLVGGLYGVSLGRIFFGESMFSLADNASKSAFIPLVWTLAEAGFALVDSQVRTEHVEGLGGRDIPRADYIALLEEGLKAPTLKGDWKARFPRFPRSALWDSLLFPSS
jgi:leucyl/phenylalanyl-tRNA--protein transferase